MVGARVRRQQVAYAQGRGLSSRRACALLTVARSTIGYVSRLVARDAGVVQPMRTLAAQYPRYGYRTIRIFLERQGHTLGTDRMYRLWRQAGLQVPKKRLRRRVAASRPRPLPPTAINHVWAYDPGTQDDAVAMPAARRSLSRSWPSLGHGRTLASPQVVQDASCTIYGERRYATSSERGSQNAWR